MLYGDAMEIRGITKADWDQVVSVLDRWWGGPSRDLAHPIFFYELGNLAPVAEEDPPRVRLLPGFPPLPAFSPGPRGGGAAAAAPGPAARTA